MNYSLLEDAWGNQNNLTSQYNKYMSDKQNNNMDQSYIQNQQLDIKPLPVPIESYNKKIQINDNSTKYRDIEHFTDVDDIECEKFMNHIKTCSKCFNKCKGLFRPKYMTHFHNFVDNNLDTIILILIFIFVLLCHNLLSNLIKSKS